MSNIAFPIPSEEFKVELRESGGEWRPVPVELLPVGLPASHERFPTELLREFGGLEEGVKMARASLCEFFWKEPVEVRVTAPGFCGDLRLSAREDIAVERPAPGIIAFRLDGPEMALVRKGDDYLHGLSLLARPAPALKTGGSSPRRLLRFAPGFHTASGNPLVSRDRFGAPVVSIAEDDTTVVIEPGARVEAAFDICGAKRVTICGGGGIDLTRRLPHAATGFSDTVLWAPFREGALPAIYVHGGAEDVTVQDITMLCDFRGVCTRNARNIKLRNLGIFTAVTNADGVNMVATEDMEAENLCIRSQDDAFCAYNNCDSIPWLWDDGFAPRPMRRVTLRNSFLASNCRTFVFGGHGQSGTRGEPNVLEDFEVCDCRVLGNVVPCDAPPPSEEHRRYWSGIFRLLSQSDEWVRRIRFHDIAVEWVPGYAGSGIHICVRSKDQVSYREKTGGWKIEDISFERIDWRNVPPPEKRIPDVFDTSVLVATVPKGQAPAK